MDYGWIKVWWDKAWRHWESLSMGALCAAVGVFVACLVFLGFSGEGWEVLILAAPVASFALGTGFWQRFIVRPKRYSSLRGALVGAVCGALAHPLCWFLIGLVWATQRNRPFDPADLLVTPLYMSVPSLIVVGWFTVPFGGLLGAVLARHQRLRRTPDAHAVTP